MASSSEPNPGQISDLPGCTNHITTNSPTTGLATIYSSTPASWSSFNSSKMAVNNIFSTSIFPVSLNGDADIHAHDSLVAAGQIGIVNPQGSNCSIVDLAPGLETSMHRTQSLDYAVILEGEITVGLEGGEARVLRRGDVVVQRATMHRWLNRSESNWARIFFVTLGAEKVFIGEKPLEEDMGGRKGELPG